MTSQIYIEIHYDVIIRSVDPKDKTFAMGILGTFFAVFGLFDLFIII